MNPMEIKGLKINKILNSLSFLTNFLNLIKFEHSVFALPFALSGAILAGKNGLPKLTTIFWIILACISARSFAMSINRIIDKDIDLKNPRTKDRELPQKIISTNQAVLFSIISLIILIYATHELPRICLLLLPIAALWFFIYPFTKRFTSLSHLWLGVALGASPLAGWLACGGEATSPIPYVLGLAVVFWVSGFDIIYACQDYKFDKENNLHSIPKKFGIKNALLISRIFHFVSVFFLAILACFIHASFIYWLSVLFVSLMLYYEQSLVKENDLTKVNLAFFTVNGWISVGFFIFILLEKLI